VGQSIVISGITTSGYNGVFNVTGVNAAAKTFTYSAASGLTTPATLGSTPLATPGSVPFNPEDVVSNDGKEFWLLSTLNVGNTVESGIQFVGSVGAGTATEIGPGGDDGQAIGIAGGQLYVSHNSDVHPVGTGLPTTAGQTLGSLPNFQT